MNGVFAGVLPATGVRFVSSVMVLLDYLVRRLLLVFLSYCVVVLLLLVFDVLFLVFCLDVYWIVIVV